MARVRALTPTTSPPTPDWAAADALRDEIAAAGWLVKDAKGGVPEVTRVAH